MGCLFHIKSKNVLIYFTISERYSVWIYNLENNEWTSKAEKFYNFMLKNVRIYTTKPSFILSNDERFILIFGGNSRNQTYDEYVSQDILIYDIEKHQIGKS